MKVLEQGKQRLSFQSSAWVVWIVAGAFVVMGGLAVAATTAGLFDTSRIEVRDGKAVAVASKGSFKERKFPLLIGGGFVVLGVAIGILASGTTTCTFDKGSGDVTVERKALVGSRSDTYRLNEVVAAEVQESTSRDSDGRSSTTYRTALVFLDGRRVPLGKIYVTGRSAQERKVQLINDFLHAG